MTIDEAKAEIESILRSRKLPELEWDTWVTAELGDDVLVLQMKRGELATQVMASGSALANADSTLVKAVCRKAYTNLCRGEIDGIPEPSPVGAS